jgi:uncharacterized protein YdcH (DUF465 family)
MVWSKDIKNFRLGGIMANKETYIRKHRHLDTRIEKLEKHNHINRTLIGDLKKTKLKLKDKMISEQRDSLRKYKHSIHNALALGS